MPLAKSSAQSSATAGRGSPFPVAFAVRKVLGRMPWRFSDSFCSLHRARHRFHRLCRRSAFTDRISDVACDTLSTSSRAAGLLCVNRPRRLCKTLWVGSANNTYRCSRLLREDALRPTRGLDRFIAQGLSICPLVVCTLGALVAPPHHNLTAETEQQRAGDSMNASEVLRFCDRRTGRIGSTLLSCRCIDLGVVAGEATMSWTLSGVRSIRTK